MPILSGEVRDDTFTLAANRAVRVYKRNTGALLAARTTSDGTQTRLDDAAAANTPLALRFRGANGSTTFADDTQNQIVTASGSAQVSTAQSPEGDQTSLYLNGTDSYLTVVASDLMTFGTSDFTVEAFVRPSALTTNNIFSQRAEATNGLTFRLSGTTLEAFHGGGNQSFGAADLVPLNTWTHVALAREGSNCRIFVNGVQAAINSSWSMNSGTATSSRIGAYGAGGELFAGYIAHLRVTIGQCRYTATFVPASVGYINVATIPTGQYYLATNYLGEVQVICLDDDTGATYNDLLLRTTLA